MGIQALVILVSIATALALGVLSASWLSSMSGAGWLAVGLLPVAMALLHLTEGISRRGIWDYTAPYPNPSMRSKNGIATQPEQDLEAAIYRKVWTDHMAA